MLLNLVITIYYSFFFRGNRQLYSILAESGNTSNFSTLNESDAVSLGSFEKTTAPKQQQNKSTALNPWFVTGFVDAEGSFTMSIFKSKTAAIGWTIEPCFIITLHKKDIELLNKIQSFFGVGTVYTVGNKEARYRVRSRLGLNVIISHFNRYSLQTTKAIHFSMFCRILNLINDRHHASAEGFLKLVSLINKLNNPLSQSLLDKLAPLGILPDVDVELSSRESSFINQDLDPWWISGFTTGEGSFTYFTRNRKKANGEIVKDYTLAYEVGQRSDSIHVLDLIAKTLECGKVYSETRGISKYRLVTRDQILSILVPFFAKYPLQGNKYLQYKLWAQIVEVLQTTGRSEQRDVKTEELIKELSKLNK